MAHKQLIEKPMIIAILGKSCAGKDTLANYLTKYFLSLGLSSHDMISMTTRPPRVNEKDKIDYYFIDSDEFNKIMNNGELIEHTHFRGWQYGVSYKEVKPGYINIGVFNLEGLKSLRRFKFDYTIIPIYLEQKLFTRLRRSYNRESKWKFEHIRRTIVDWWDFLHVDEQLSKFNGRYLVLKNIDDVEEQSNKIVKWLIKRNILKHSKEGNSLVLGNFV